jgi:hypothetical protein
MHNKVCCVPNLPGKVMKVERRVCLECGLMQAHAADLALLKKEHQLCVEREEKKTNKREAKMSQEGKRLLREEMDEKKID